MHTPIIEIKEYSIIITGSQESLIALGEILITKGKIGENMSVVFYDGIRKPIEIKCKEDIQDL